LQPMTGLVGMGQAEFTPVEIKTSVTLMGIESGRRSRKLLA